MVKWMARPTKWRKIEHVPVMPFFIPSETQADELPENIIKLEELEAIRLKDLEGLEQEECAKRMEVSRPTFQNILQSAREKVADSLIHGKMIRVEGGNFTRNICPVHCENCGKEWKESFENFDGKKSEGYVCPNCRSDHVTCQDGCTSRFCQKSCKKQSRAEKSDD